VRSTFRRRVAKLERAAGDDRSFPFPVSERAFFAQVALRMRRTGESFEQAVEGLVEKLNRNDVQTLIAELERSGNVDLAEPPAPDEEPGSAPP
jgi:hypothetical protein